MVVQIIIRGISIVTLISTNKVSRLIILPDKNSISQNFGILDSEIPSKNVLLFSCISAVGLHFISGTKWTKLVSRKKYPIPFN